MLTLQILPTKLVMFLCKKMPEKFLKNERIVRHVYTEDHYNTKTKKLKTNFVGFAHNPTSNKYELSCNRFEMETIHHCHTIGKINTTQKRVYFGFAIISVSAITDIQNYSLFYSPLINKGHLNYSHSDIYDNNLPGVPKHELGEALSAKMLLERDVFVKKWKVYSESENLQKKHITYH